MVRAQSIHRWGRERIENGADGFCRGGPIPWYRRHAGTCAAIVLLIAATAEATAGSGPGLALKIGAQTLEDPVDLDNTTRARYELELSSARQWDGHLDFAFIFGGSSLGTVSDDLAYWDDDVFVEESYEDDLTILDLRLAARLYPFGDSEGIQPYVGAGVGYFWFIDRWEDTYAETVEDPMYPGSWITFETSDEDTETLAQGFFPFVMAGVAVPVTDNFELMFEFQYDLEKKDSGYDLGGPIYLFGARLRF